MKRTTILVGAGATMEIGGPTSCELRNRIINSCRACLGKRQPVLRQIGERLEMKSNGNFNFEDLYHIVEQLSSYNVGWNDDRYDDNTLKKNTPDLAYFTRPSQKEWLQPLPVWMKCVEHIIRTIAYEVNAYSSRVNGESYLYNWYKDFWRQYSTCADIITLNYDTTIEHSIRQYIDGFNKEGNFDPSILLKAQGGKTTISHLHGCIVFGQNKKDPNHSPLHNLSKYKSYDESEHTWFSLSNIIDSEDGQITPTPIITGRLKSEKLQVQPFVSYYHHLQDSLLKNERLLIVGYSFGDEHINSYIRLYRQVHPAGEIIIVAKNNVYDIPKNDGTRLTDYIDIFNEKERAFLSELCVNKWRLQNDENDSSYLTFGEGIVKLYTDGFKSYVEKHLITS